MLIAAIQLNSTEDRISNIRKTVYYIEEAVKNKAQLIALPENFAYLKIEGEAYPFLESFEGELIMTLRGLARQHRVYILTGSFPESIDGTNKTYNTSIMLNSNGEIIGHYRKIHLFNYGINTDTSYQESNYVKPGTETSVIDTEWCKVGITICYDLRFPELYRVLALKGAKIIFVPSAFTMSTGKDHWEVLLKARAIENQVYIVAPNQFGKHSENRVSYGHSMIVGPWGTPVAQAQDREEIIYANIDFDYLEKVRQKLPSLNHIQNSLFPFN
ncbi:MAG: carbon-nitrogen hydrolase family protein [Spirochaetota bacterium]|nr:carbon-nitrogen hydrolase family protein [Spirochaetota bacterium]